MEQGQLVHQDSTQDKALGREEPLGGTWARQLKML